MFTRAWDLGFDLFDRLVLRPIERRAFEYLLGPGRFDERLHHDPDAAHPPTLQDGLEEDWMKPQPRDSRAQSDRQVNPYRGSRQRRHPGFTRHRMPQGAERC